MQAVFMSILRSVLISAGTYGAAKGWFDQGQVETIVSSALVLVAAAWGVAEKMKRD